MTKMINMQYGGGETSAVMDIRTGRAYLAHNNNDREELIRDFDAVQYYCSRSGRRGALNVPARPYLTTIPTMRVDTREARRVAAPPIHYQRQIVAVPYDYRNRDNTATPAILVWCGEGYGFINSHHVHSFLIGDAPTATQSFEYDFWVSVDARASKVLEIPIWGLLRVTPLMRRMLIEALGLPFQMTDEERARQYPNGHVRPEWAEDEMFFKRLGLERYESEHGTCWLYRMAAGMCHERLPVDADRAALESASPSNVLWLADNLYIQGDLAGGWHIVGRVQVGDRWYDYEDALDTDAALALLSLDAAEIERQREFINNMAAEKAALRGRLGHDPIAASAIIVAHADYVLTVEDSVRAGNCKTGTLAWAGEHFPGRNSLALRELTPHLSDPRVCRVITALGKHLGETI